MFNPRSAVLVLLLLLGLGAPSLGRGQGCSDAVIFDPLSGGSGGPLWRFTNAPGNCTTVGWEVDFIEQPDPARPWINTTNIGMVWGSLNPRCVTGSCNYYFFDSAGNDSRDALPGGVWKSAPPGGNGYYMVVGRSQGRSTTPIYVWLVEGTWTTTPPGGEAPPEWSGGTGGGSCPAAEMWFYVTVGDSTNNVNVQVKVTNGGTSATVNTANGVGWLNNVPCGQYTVKVTGTVGGTTINWTGYTQMNGAKKTVTLNFGADGSFGGGEGIGTTPGDSGSAAMSQYSWWEGLMRVLFTPSQSKLDAVKARFNEFLEWGPFQVLTFLLDMHALKDEPGELHITIPIPCIETPEGLEGQATAMDVKPCQNPPDAMEIIESVNDDNPEFQKWRSYMGAAIYLGFAFGLAKNLMPKATV